ncbi:MAG: hypothetical protein KAR44_09255 [Candidatus Aegiribacteria sp.]|nr:hypothetical protein [Candidatus Aegiribacteria sp.]
MKNVKKKSKKTTTGGIAGLKQKNILENYTVMRENLIESIKLPELSYKGPKHVKRGSTIRIDVRGLLFPDVDLWKGKLIKRRKMLEDHSISALFNIAGEPALLQAKYNSKKNEILVTLPDDAESDVLMMLFPVREYYGEYGVLQKLDPEDLIINREIGNTCDCGEKNGNSEKCMKINPLKDELLSVVRYYAVYVCRLTMQCSTCAVECPYGAIKFDDEGACYVDIDLCRGQSYVIDGTEVLPDGREVFVNGGEVICWECFVGDEKYSRKCRNRKLRRVAINGPCCGNCKDINMPTGLNFQELCPYGAVTHPGGFDVDPELCEGCFACILNIACTNNSRNEEFDQRSIRMVSYIGDPLFTYSLHMDRVRLEIDRELPDELGIDNLDLALVLESELEKKRFPFTLEERLTHSFDDTSIRFTEDVTFMLMKDGSVNSIINLDRGFGVATRTVRLNPSLINVFMGFRGKVIFPIPFGKLVFMYRIKQHLQLSALQEELEHFELP